MIYADQNDAIFVDSYESWKFQEGPAVFDLLLDLQWPQVRDVLVMGYSD